MNKDLIIKKIKSYENEYKHFMNIKKFPIYEIQTREASISIANSQGFESVASTFYDLQTNQHTLIVSTNLELSKYVIFHEFTHMLDSEMYVKNDKMRYAGLSGFTEYHASQVELMLLLNANTINHNLSFSLNNSISTIAGEKTVYQYIKTKQQHAIELFSSDVFPTDISTLKTSIGILYNYLGLRSICEMYATDYMEEVDNNAFLKYIPLQLFSVLNNTMHSWLNETQIEQSINIYINIIFPLIMKYNLK